ncbi:MAG TPA: PEP-CTERM sorting domain-containing protein [Tepidisphaeraceae bacterium]|nr:PEP-CTERM sorting domain-containing protein [Tepidisphaeraceae bacterium]
MNVAASPYSGPRQGPTEYTSELLNVLHFLALLAEMEPEPASIGLLVVGGAGLLARAPKSKQG